MAGKKCDILFQHSAGNLGKKGKVKDMAPETLESLSIKFEMILDFLKRIEEHINDLPCKDHDGQIQENKFHVDRLREDYIEIKKELNEEIYSRLRKVEGKAIKLAEQNVGQNAWSGKMWALIVLGINSIFLIAIYFITRGTVT